MSATVLRSEAAVTRVSGPIVTAAGMHSAQMYEVVQVVDTILVVIEVPRVGLPIAVGVCWNDGIEVVTETIAITHFGNDYTVVVERPDFAFTQAHKLMRGTR